MDDKKEEKRGEGMKEEAQEEYRFSPRPEAHAMNWGELLSPLRHAVRDLLLLLDGAVTQIDHSIKEPGSARGDQVTASCFLVYGERGTGKSTVLLSAQEAVCKDNRGYFSTEINPQLEENPKEKQFRLDAMESAKRLRDKGAIWLDVLDLESLPPHANMLTTMLTRVRYALDIRGCVNNPLRRSSIIEEDADSARHQLTRLLNDATLMWEDIKEPDTRNRANRQIAAADIYTDFRARFQKAIEALSRELGRSGGSSGECRPIILPIDNIDRSTDHLYNIIKLAQMVASPFLWLVLAGDREDVETFLERAYWKELISIGEGAGGVGKTGIGKEDEALVMARRQAAAASHKLLPPSHRIEVEMVRPQETLRFTRVQGEADIYTLFHSIDIYQKKGSMTLIDILDAGRHSDGSKRKSDEELTHAAKLALQLPARVVVDLWQHAHRMLKDKQRYTGAARDDDFRAEKIARSMLRHIISESKIPNEMGLYLQEKIIHREPDGTTTLKFCKPNPDLSVKRWRAPEFQRRLYPTLLPDAADRPRFAVRSTLSALGQEEVLIVSLSRPDSASSDLLELPPAVAGWLLILHDTVLEAERSWVLAPGSDTDVEVRFVAVLHDVVRSGRGGVAKTRKVVWWPAPRWETYLAQDVFWIRWKKYWSFVEAFWAPDEENRRKRRTDYMAWVLVVGWVACVLDTFWAITGQKLLDSELEDNLYAGVIRDIKDTVEVGSCVRQCEIRMLNAAAALYVAIMNKGETYTDLHYKKNGPSDDAFFRQQSLILMRDWLEQKLPLLLSHLYVPLNPDVAGERQETLKEWIAWSVQEPTSQEPAPRESTDEAPPAQSPPAEGAPAQATTQDFPAQDQNIADQKEKASILVEAWNNNFPFIYADYRADLADLFSTGDPAAPGEAVVEEWEMLGSFADLYRLLSLPVGWRE